MNDGKMEHSLNATNLADILERVLDKGIVIAGDVTISLVGVELLNIKLRLLIASVDKAMEMGINWWAHDPFLTAGAQAPAVADPAMLERMDRLEAALATALASNQTTPMKGHK
ncbi:gas vesicle structural protein GvpJ [Octadecabacter antarcticus 307]|uniref:Gas vesicle structural protein GvpJ n=1 Tax=Octadecabacter antarcticus 307 TaxID=391626 RepID=M9R9U4_9RHOB|nr:gas vesicle protein [Octadecabacter antarcticus]AGI68583.1 gas vesicle structural protein GvpJ [Octadecabacter antarcticus 307]